MKKNIELIVVPDVHGRSFWKEALPYIEAGVETVFLGDYHDPYPDEGITEAESLANFEEIVALARRHSNVHLLLGNHDCGYWLDSDFCSCRHDYDNHLALKRLFDDNGDLFGFAYETVVAGRRFMLSHAGIHPVWVQRYQALFGNPASMPSAATVNEAPSRNPVLFVEALGVYSNMRGWSGNDYGSIVWGDLRDYQLYGSQYPDVVQIVGHTQISGPVSFGNIIGVDTRQCYYIGTDGRVLTLGDDTPPFEAVDDQE